MSTSRDKAILNTILNPFLPSEEFDEEDDFSDLKDDEKEVTQEILEAKRLEKKAIILTENGQTNEGLEIFDRAIKLASQLPSLYNNRAQCYRLIGDTQRALDDLNIALIISKEKGRSARQAFCQRGLIRRKNGQEVEAMEDFKNAARLGSPFAKMVLVHANPYAALCNDMLSQIMEKFITPQHSTF